MHDHADARHLDVEQPARFDHFQSLVEERRGINGDLAPHDPRRMFEGAFDGDLGKFFFRPQFCVAEWSAARRKPELADGRRRLAVETLEDRRVLAVHGQDAHAVFPRLVHHDFAGHDEDFLRGHGDVFPGANRRQRRLQPRRADDGDQHDVGLRQRGQFHQAFRAGKNFARGAESRAKFLGLGGIVDGDSGGLMLACLVEQQFGIVTRRQGNQPDALGQIFRHLYRAGADGAGAA